MIKSHLKKALLAAALVTMAAAGALALDVDQNRNTVARQYVTHQPAFYRITVNFNDPRQPTAQKFGRLLQNTFINGISCHGITAFNAGSTNPVTIGTSTTATELVAASGANASISTGSTGYANLTAAAGLGVAATSDADHDLYVKYAPTGTAATAGKLTCVIEFVPNDDL